MSSYRDSDYYFNTPPEDLVIIKKYQDPTRKHHKNTVITINRKQTRNYSADDIGFGFLCGYIFGLGVGVGICVYASRK